MHKFLRFLSLLLTATIIISASTMSAISNENSYDIAGTYEKQEFQMLSAVISTCLSLVSVERQCELQPVFTVYAFCCQFDTTAFHDDSAVVTH